MSLDRKVSNQRQCHKMTFVKRKWRSRRHNSGCYMPPNAAAVILAIIAAILLTITNVAYAKLETQIKLLINDEALLLEQAKQQAPQTEQHSAGAASGSLPRNAEEQQHYEMYRSSDLKRLSYETIHRILRDENEPMYRREDAEMHYYQKRSYQPPHEVYRRAVDDEPPVYLLNFTRANLTDLALIAGVNVAAVRELDVSFNRLSAVNLSRFEHLQHADLSHNLLTALPAANKEFKLTVLNLNGNAIQHASPTVAFQHLRELHLSSNFISNLSALNLSALVSLEILDLSCNRIENLETAFFPQRMHNLKYLNLANNRLSSIYRETFYNLLSLNTLVLKHNNITDIDYETFLALPNLQYLDLSHNRLHGESIRALQGIPDLVGLSIAFNLELGGFMQEFVASWSLKELDASGAGLCQIPAALAQSVRTLKLTDNWLKIINCGDLDSYPLLQYLDLSQSRIEDIEDDALGRLEILEVLFLDHNNLQKVPTSLPTSLQHLFLQHNDILDIQLQAFQGLNQLQTLDLSRNKLLYLPALPLPKLQMLNLQSSELRGINQAIVNTLPRLRDILLEDNPIKCSELLGIAEWVSPCRISEHTSNNAIIELKTETIDADELGQFQNKIDLKQQFVQMHNFLEKFKTKCGQQIMEEAATAIAAPPPPLCAIEMDAETETAIMEEVEFIMASNLPTEPEIQAKTTTNSNDEKLYDNHLGNFAKSLQQSAQNNETATAAPATTAAIAKTKTVETNEGEMSTTTTAATATAAGAIISTPTQGSSNSTVGKVLTAHATDKSFAASFAATTAAAEMTSKSIFPTTKENLKKLPTLKSTTAGFAFNKLPATTTMSATARAANQDELPTMAAAIINAKEVASMTTPTAAINPTTTTTASTTKEIPSTSSLNNSDVIAKTENVDTTTLATTTTTTDEAKTTTVTIYALPQTIPATIISGNKNYVETTSSSSSLLNQQGLKTSSSSIVVAATAAAREDKTKSDSNSKMLLESLSSKRQQLNFNGISGQQHIGALPTTEETILPNQQQQQQSHIINNTLTHRHEPLQLHIKNRHLIGTPLLMHKGHNILVEPEQLLLPTAATTKTTTAATTLIRISDEKENAVKKSSKESQADKLALRQRSQESAETRQFLADNDDKLQQQQQQKKSEAIFVETNEQSKNAIKSAEVHAIASADMRSLPATTEIINRKTAKSASDDTKTSDANKKMETITKLPKSRTDKKKKLSLTMKKMTITKHAGIAQQAQAAAAAATKHHHQALNTPRENEAVPLMGRERAGELVGWQIFKEIKTEQSFIEPNPLPHKHSAVNTPTNHMVQHELPKLSAVEQQLTPQNSLSKSEQWLDVRKSHTSTGHPGLVILISLISFIILLLGLIQVYRCDKPWRRQLAAQQRPHQFSEFNSEDCSNSFLSYQQQRQINPASKQWHHSARLLPPRCSPLHNLHVRELQQISAVENQQLTTRAKQNFQQTLNSSTSDTSRSSSSYSSSTGAVLKDDAFYIEMTPDSGQPAGSQHLHSDLLPMELLSSTASQQQQQQHFLDATELDISNEQHQQQPLASRASAASPTDLALFSGELMATHNKTLSEKRLPVVKLAPTTRKLGLW